MLAELKKGAPLAVSAVNYFLELLGNFIHIVCIGYLPEGGVYLFGGDFCRLIAALKESRPESLRLLVDNFLLEGHLKPRFSEFRTCVCVGEAELDFDKVLKHL